MHRASRITALLICMALLWVSIGVQATYGAEAEMELMQDTEILKKETIEAVAEAEKDKRTDQMEGSKDEHAETKIEKSEESDGEKTGKEISESDRGNDTDGAALKMREEETGNGSDEEVENSNSSADTENSESTGREDDSEDEEGADASENTDGPENPQNPQESQDPDLPPITMYELHYPEANGDNGYYREKPEVKITSTCARGETVYRMVSNEKEKKKEDKDDKEEKDEKQMERTLSGENKSVVLPDDWFAEGKNTLRVWMQEEGQIVENSLQEVEFPIDTKPPKLTLQADGGFDGWHREQAVVHAKAEDAVSGVKQLTYEHGGKTVTKEASQVSFEVSEASVGGRVVSVTVKAKDKAGNTTEKTRTLRIDRAAPVLSVSGISDMEITGKEVLLGFHISEENVIGDITCELTRVAPDGSKEQEDLSSLFDGSASQEHFHSFKKDGRYLLRLTATDMAGHLSNQSIAFLIDRKSPVIRYVEGQDHTYQKSFRWKYTAEEYISDFTTYSYEIRLDGELYHTGKRVTTEGNHTLQVMAVDAAGNRSKKTAQFVIDHTAPDIQIRNLEDGASYEEGVQVEIVTGKKEDTLKTVQVNGKTMGGAGRGKNRAVFRLDEEGEYEIAAAAKDYAGNLAEKKLYIRIENPKNTPQKVMERFTQERERIPEDQKRDIATAGGEKTGKKQGTGTVFRVLPVLGALVAGAGILPVILKKRRRQKEK